MKQVERPDHRAIRLQELPHKTLRRINTDEQVEAVAQDSFVAAAIAIGRVGCFLAGLDDMTYGTPTTLPWGIDFGDGVHRHPVQLYESIAMAAFLAVFVILLRRGSEPVLRTGFYIFVGVYAAQRFVWEFLKPYGTVIGPFNLFHLLSLALIAYAFLYARREAPRTCSTLARSSP